MKKYSVYMHTCPNGKVYIGITSINPLKRWKNGQGYYKNDHFFKAIKNYGWDNIKHEILFVNLTEEEACQKEIELIASYNSNNPNYGYNNTIGGKGCVDPNTFNLPPLNNILNNSMATMLLKELIKSCFPNEVIETKTTKEYDKDGNLIKEERIEKKKKIEPNLYAVNLILDSFENEPLLKDIIEEIKKVKAKYDI